MPTNGKDPQLTKQQLANFLFNGDINVMHNPTQPVTDLTSFGHRAIDYAVQHNPTAAYQWIKRVWGDKYPNYGRGLEYNRASMEAMITFLTTSYDNLPDASKAAWVTTFMHSIPKNPNINNWTVPIN